MKNNSTTRRLALPAVAVTATMFALAGCAGSTSPNETGGDGGGDDAYNVTMILGVSGDEGYLTDACGATKVAEENGVKLDIQAPDQFDPAPQTQVLQAAIAKNPDAIIIAPTDTTAMIAPIQQAIQAGIKVILFDTTLDDLTGIETVVGVDNAAGGKLAAEALAELVGEEGSVFVNNVNPGISTTDARQAGFEEGIAEFSGVNYLGPQFNNNDPQKAASITSSMLTANPDLAGIFGTNLFSVEGTVTGLRNSDALGDVKIVGFDATPSEVEALENGEVQALVAQKLNEMGATAMQATIDVLDGKDVEDYYEVGFQVITQDNLDTPESQAALYKADCN